MDLLFLLFDVLEGFNAMGFLILLLIIGFIYLLVRVNRLERLIKSGSIPSSAPQQVPVQPPVHVSAPTGDALASADHAFVPSTVSKPVAPAPQPHKKFELTDSKDFEFKLGGKFFTIVGAVAVLFGVSFFLRYAFENNLITETARVVLGIIAGFALLVIGETVRKKYALYSHIVSGAGLGVLYLSFYAAYNFYDLVAQPVAFIAMVVVTALGFVLALHNRSLALAGWAMIGGYLTPILLFSHDANMHALFIFVILLNTSSIALAWNMRWSELALGSFIGTGIVYAVWFFSEYASPDFGMAIGYATAFFALYLALIFVKQIWTGERDHAAVVALTILNPIFYFLVGYALINTEYPESLGLFTALLGCVYLMLGLIALVLKQHMADSRIRMFLFALSAALFFLAIPIQFDKQWVSIFWSLEAAILGMIGALFGSRYFQISSRILFGVVLFRLLALDAHSLDASIAWMNERFIVFGFVALVMIVLSAWYVYQRRVLSADGRQSALTLMTDIALISLGAYLLLLWMVSTEVYEFYPDYWIPVVWSLFGLLAGVISFAVRVKALRVVSYITLVIAFFSVFAYSQIQISDFVPVLNMRVVSALAVAACLVIMALIIKHHSEHLEEGEKDAVRLVFFLLPNILLLWLLTVEVLDIFNHKLFELGRVTIDIRERYENYKNVSVSVLWAFYGVIMLIRGIVSRTRNTRVASIVLLLAVIIKVFLFDTAHLDNFYRFVSFITLGIILLVIGYLYQRYRERISEFIKGEEVSSAPTPSLGK